MRCIKRVEGVWCPNEATATGLCSEHLPGTDRKIRRPKKEDADSGR